MFEKRGFTITKMLKKETSFQQNNLMVMHALLHWISPQILREDFTFYPVSPPSSFFFSFNKSIAPATTKK